MNEQTSQTVFRIEKRENPYVQLDHNVLLDTRLSWKAKGLLAYLLSRPKDWVILSCDIIAQSTDGRESVQAGMRELRDAGYATLETIRDTNGVAGRRWVIREVPLKDGKPVLQEPMQNARQTEFPSVGKPAPTKKDSTKTDRKKKDKPLQGFRPNLADVDTFFTGELHLPTTEANQFFYHYEANGWVQSNKKPIVNWKMAAHGWKSRLGKFAQNGARNGSGVSVPRPPAPGAATLPWDVRATRLCSIISPKLLADLDEPKIRKEFEEIREASGMAIIRLEAVFKSNLPSEHYAWLFK